MAKASFKHHIYGEVDSKSDLGKIFSEIRKDIEEAKNRAELTELYKRAGYLITLTYAPSWEKKFGDEAEDLRKFAAAEFTITVNKLNHRANKVGTESDYDDKWGHVK